MDGSSISQPVLWNLSYTRLLLSLQSYTELPWATLLLPHLLTCNSVSLSWILFGRWAVSCYCYGWVGGGSVNGFKVPPHWQTSLYCFRILYTISLQTVGILENSGIILMPLCEVGPLKAILRTSWSLYCNSGSVIRVPFFQNILSHLRLSKLPFSSADGWHFNAANLGFHQSNLGTF